MGEEDIPQIPESNWIENSTSYANKSKAISDFRARLRVMVDDSEKRAKVQNPTNERNINIEIEER